jgi:hypothetical protein
MMFRNRIINGDMRIDQRNGGGSVSNTGSTVFALDRWKTLGTSSDGVYSIQQSTDAPTNFYNSMLFTVVTTDSSLSNSNRYTFNTSLEGYSIDDFNFGTANAVSITISFWVKSSITGAFSGSVSNGDSSISYPFSYTINSANTWEQKYVTILGDTSGTWQTGINRALILNFTLGAGSDYLGTANTWSVANSHGVTGTTNLMATNGATFYITGVQLEKGTVATQFEHRPIGTELALCQRYYEKSTELTEQFPLYKAREADRLRLGTIQYKVTKRATPSIILLGANGDGGGTPSSASIGIYAFRIFSTATSDTSSPYVNGYSAEAEL